jgi:LmbE family N-acetylglucosaminyl deacetylase
VIRLLLGAGSVSVLCLGAHPDDIEIGCGGALLAMRSAGRISNAVVAVLSGPDERAEEARTAAERFLPGSTVRTFSLRDGYFPAQWTEAKLTLESLATEHRPDVIFAPRADDSHQDHRTLAQLVPTVWRDAIVLNYEIPKWDGDLRPVTHYIPFDETIVQEKLAALDDCFPSQHRRDWWDHTTFRGLARLRGLECRSQFAEGFLVAKAALGF